MSERYYQHDHKAGQERLKRRFRWFGWGMGVALVIGIIVIVIYSFFLVSAEDPSVTSTAQTSVISPAISVFQTPYYQFQANDGWEEVKVDEENKYFYRKRNRAAVEHDLTVYVNPSQRTINGVKATRVQVVNPAETNDGTLNPVDGISKWCNEAGPDIEDLQLVTFAGTTFRCIAGGALYDVLVSEMGGTPLITLKRPNGGTVQLLIYYRDLRAVEDGGELDEIVNTFQAR